MSAPSINDTIVGAAPDLPDEQREAIVTALIEREDGIASMMHMAGMQFGLYPQIIAEVLAGIEFGSPMSEQQRTMIRAQFTALMEEFRRQAEGGGV